MHRMHHDIRLPLDVERWIPCALQEGLAFEGLPWWATLSRASIAEDEDLEIALLEASFCLEQGSTHPELVLGVSGVTPRTWERIEFRLWQQLPDVFDGQAYQVLHVSHSQWPKMETEWIGRRVFRQKRKSCKNLGVDGNSGKQPVMTDGLSRPCCLAV